MAQEVSWLVGDSGKDIFNGLAVRGRALERERYVRSERVTVIEDGCVKLDVSDLDELDANDEPPRSEQLRPD